MSRVTPADVPSLADTKSVPRFTGGRIDVLDALRGFAVLGILLANVQVFSGFVLLDEAQRSTLAGAGADRVVLPLLQMFVEGKFYSIFSLLFGIGFAIQLRRVEAASQDFARRFRRRLSVLLVIGAVHAFLIWYGDILMLYALAGFALLALRSREDRAILRSAVIFALIPLVIYGLMLGAMLLFGSGSEGVPENGATSMDPFIAAFATGGYADALRANLTGLGFRWLDLFFTGRFFKVLAMFLLGMWVVRRGLLTDGPDNRALLARVARWGLGLGVPLNAAMALVGSEPYYMLQPRGALFAVLYSVGVPTLALGYAAGVVTLWRRARARRVLSLFVPVGRMALTNYLLHSVVAALFFYGVGLGFFGRIGATVGLALATLLFVAQIPASGLWMRHFRHGPVEWVWRRATAGERVELRR